MIHQKVVNSAGNPKMISNLRNHRRNNFRIPGREIFFISNEVGWGGREKRKRERDRCESEKAGDKKNILFFLEICSDRSGFIYKESSPGS